MKKFLFALCALVTLTVLIGLASRQISSASIQINIVTKQPAPLLASANPEPEPRYTQLSGRVLVTTLFSLSIFTAIIMCSKEVRNKQKKSNLKLLTPEDPHSPLL